MKFITRQTNIWHTENGEDGPFVTLTPRPHSLLNLHQWRAVRSLWPSSMPVAVALDNDTDVADIASDLDRVAMLALSFPKWVDGRAYTQARLLRARYRYQGEIWATGEVLVDMIPMLARTGFTAAILRADQNLDNAQRALSYFPEYYQGDVSSPLPLFRRTEAPVP